MSHGSRSLDEIIKSLDRERDQEEFVDEHRGSFFDQAPDRETLILRAQEYDDLEKHIVRRESWLTIAKDLAQKKGAPLRVLTLPGRHRLEVELYRSEGIFGSYDPEAGLPVVGFETSPDIFGLLKSGVPRLEKVFHEDLVRALIDERASAYGELRALFPFDIINLDLTGNLVAPSEGPYGPVLEAIRECLKLQGGSTGDWAFMLTFRAVIEHTNQDTIEKLSQHYQENINRHPVVKEACYGRYNSFKANQIIANHSRDALGQFMSKWIVEQAHTFDFRLRRAVHAGYVRSRAHGEYSIDKLAFQFRRERTPPYSWPGEENLPWHIEDIMNVVNAKRDDVSKKLRILREKQPDYIQRLEREIEHLKTRADDVGGA